jgi:4-amino-4-deoxy-L-arabinose transferase-like glycosyltransferase
MQLIDNVTFNEKQQGWPQSRFSTWAGKLAQPYVLLAIISIIAIFFRFYELGQWSFWIDELFTARDALDHQYSIFQMYKVGDPASFGLELISVTLLLIRLVFNSLGISEWSARLAPAVIGTLTIPLFYFPIRKMFDPSTALIAAALLAISNWHLYLSQNARYYPALLLFYTLALCLVYFSLEEGNPFYFLYSLVLLGLAALERAHALLFVPVVVFYFSLLITFSFEIPRWLNLRNAIILVMTPVMVYIGYDAYRVFYAGDLSIVTVLLSGRFFGSPVLRPDWILTGTITNIGSPLVVLAVVGGYSQLKARSRPGLFLISGAVVPIAIIMALAPFFFTGLHYTLLVLPCWIVLAAIGLKALYSRASTSPGWIGLVLGLMLLLFLRDRVIRDLIYFYGQAIRPGLLVGASLLALAGVAGGLFWLVQRFGQPASNSTSGWLDRTAPATGKLTGQVKTQRGRLGWSLVVVILLAHQLGGNYIYYEYQHGYRDNDWRSALQVVRENKEDTDLVVSAMAPVASYYLGEEVVPLTEIDLDTVLDTRRPVWFIDESGVDDVMGDRFAIWAGEHCKVVEEFGRYMRGRFWKLNVQLCEPDRG